VFLTLALEQRPEEADIDPQLQNDLFFSAVAGARYNAGCKFLLDLATRGAMVCLGIVLEPIRYLTAWWMRRAREIDSLSRFAIRCSDCVLADSLRTKRNCMARSEQDGIACRRLICVLEH
jgi:hypothetical protein